MSDLNSCVKSRLIPFNGHKKKRSSSKGYKFLVIGLQAKQKRKKDFLIILRSDGTFKFKLYTSKIIIYIGHNIYQSLNDVSQFCKKMKIIKK